MRINRSIISNQNESVPLTRTLTIGGVTYDLSQDRTWAGGGGGGTVTSVAMTVPTGLSITGSPITTSGTLALTFAAGYSLPTTVKQSNWDDAYTFVAGFPSQTSNSGKYLTTDGSALSWATVSGGSATPGGSDTQVQYNNTGAFGGATNVKIVGGNLTLMDAGFPSAPSAGHTTVFMDLMANRSLVGAIGSDGTHLDFQPSLFNSTTYLWLAGTGTTLAINWGTSFTARNNGTSAAQAHPTKSSTSAITSMNRATFSTGTTATGASGIQSSATNAWRGNAANLGGFFFFARFALEATSGSYRFFIGLSENNATLNAQPSTLNNTLGIGMDSTDSNLQFMVRNTTTTTRVNTTAASNTTSIFDFYMYAPPNGSEVHFELRDGTTNTVLKTQTESSNLPANTVFMYMQSHIQSVTGTTAKLLALNRMYLETNI
jgi:hypothetical protein